MTRLAWPICVSMLSYSTMTVADTAFVSSLGPSALAGVGLGGMLAFSILVFGIGLARALKVLVSQALGSGQEDRRIAQLEAAGLMVALVLGLVFGGLGTLLSALVPKLAESAAAGAAAADYVQIRMLGAPLLLLFSVAKESSYGLGDTRSPMISSLCANLLNILLDWFFIIVLDAGVAGAAWATCIATAVELALILWLRRRPALLSFRGCQHWVKPILRVGVATGGQFAAEVGAFTLLTILVASMAELEMAGHQVALTLVHFGFLPIVAIGEAGSVLAGQAVGGDRDDLFPKISQATYLLGIYYSAAFTLLLLCFGDRIVTQFGSDPKVHEVAAHLLVIAATFQIVDSINIVSRSLLRGTGDVRVPAYVCIFVSWAALPPLTYLFGIELEQGAAGAWFALCCEIVAASGFLCWRVMGGGWKVWAERSRASLRDVGE